MDTAVEESQVTLAHFALIVSEKIKTHLRNNQVPDHQIKDEIIQWTREHFPRVLREWEERIIKPEEFTSEEFANFLRSLQQNPLTFLIYLKKLSELAREEAALSYSRSFPTSSQPD